MRGRMSVLVRRSMANLSRLTGLWAGAGVRLIPGQLAEERSRWVLWLPVGLGTGVACYFALTVEPPVWIGGAASAIFLGAALVLRQRLRLSIPLLALAVVSAGFALAQLRSAAVASPMLRASLGPVTVVGRAAVVEPLPGALRVTLEAPEVTGLAADRTPDRLRLRLSGRQPDIVPGDRVRVRAMLRPPPPPAAPGAFDFQRRAYFQRLGAVGFAFGQARLVAAEEGDISEAFGHRVEAVRHDLGNRVQSAVPGDTGAVARALMTGERGAIPASMLTAMRDSGLAHLLAISGLHIGLVAGFLFVGIRSLLALVPWVALRYPIKKWAAVAALLGALVYAVIAGATVPTQRAFLMIGLVLVAVLLERRGLGMRTVAWAATVILVFRPESLLGASFQLSFAAVTALIAGYEAFRARRRPGPRGPWSLARRIGLYLGGVASTTVIAGIATGPFAIYHFNRLAAYGLAANLGAVPLTALWIMPWAVIAFLLMPFGLERLALIPMAWGIDAVLAIAGTVAAWPGAVSLLPAMPTFGFLAVVAGGLWLCLWQRRWRLAGLAGVAVGFATLALVRPPDILVDGQGRLLAVRAPDRTLAVSSLRVGRFDRETWLRRSGQEGPATAWPAAGLGLDGRLSCDSLACIFHLEGRRVALVRRPEALPEDCRRADIVVSVVPVRRACPSADIVVDRFDLWRNGGHAIWLRDGAVRVDSVHGRRGNRPWVLRPEGAAVRREARE